MLEFSVTKGNIKLAIEGREKVQAEFDSTIYQYIVKNLLPFVLNLTFET